MEKETFTRNELYDLVWSVPLLTLSKKYAISDVGLRKICIKMEIPLPKAGHWQKLQFNKKTNQPKLSANYNGDKEVILSLRTEEMKNIAASPSPSKILQQQIEKEMQPTLSVPEKLSKPDELIIAARESLNRKDRYEHNGMVSFHPVLAVNRSKNGSIGLLVLACRHRAKCVKRIGRDSLANAIGSARRRGC